MDFYQDPDDCFYLARSIQLHPVFKNSQEFRLYTLLMSLANPKPEKFLTPELDEIMLEPGHIRERPHEIAKIYGHPVATFVEQLIDRLVAHELVERTMGILRLTRVGDHVLFEEPENFPHP